MRLPACPRCGGPVMLDGDGDARCWTCGRCPAWPPRPPTPAEAARSAGPAAGPRR